jgi:hypothetical protein
MILLTGKMKTILLAGIVLLAGMPALSQQELPAEPQRADVFMRLDAGKLLPLEHQRPVVKSKNRGFIVSSVTRLLKLKGATSTVRFHSAATLEFLVRMDRPGLMDPGSFYVLRKLQVKHDSREMTLMSARGTPIGVFAKRNLRAEGLLPLDFSNYGQASLKLTAHDLPPGEYAISRASGFSIFCFGVD